MSYYVYVLKSKKDKKLYIGQTNNFERRIREHMFGKVLSTKNRRPFEVLGYKECITRAEARWIEHQAKKHESYKNTLLDSILRRWPPAPYLRFRETSGSEKGLWPGGW